MGHSGKFLHELAEVAGKGLGLTEVGAGGEVHINHELRTRGRREEALVDIAETAEAGGEADDGEDDHQPTVAQGGGEESAVDPEDAFGVGIGRCGRSGFGQRLEEEIAEQRRGGDRRNPAQAQGD